MRALTLAVAVCFAAIVPAHAVETIRCEARPEQSYELYLPSDYPSDRTWPILYMLDPRSRGRVPIEIYREAAERYGYILASSNNTRSDGPAQTNFEAMQAMLDDTFARYRVDPRRLYAVGMSGGARAACEIAAKLAGRMPGVILVGATCPAERRLRKKTPFDVFGIVGDTDFNFLEMQELDDRLERLGLTHRLIGFEGRHGWHGGTEADRALEWLELRAIARELRADENGFVEARYESALAVAREADEAGRPVDAWRAYRRVMQTFEGLRPLEEFRARFAELGKNREVKRMLQRRREMLRKEGEQTQAVEQILATLLIPGPRPTVPALAAQLGIDQLESDTREAAEDEAGLSRRILETIFVQTAFYIPRELRDRGDAARAALSLELATEIRDDSPEVRYNLACAQAVAGKTQEALRALRLAVDLGFSSLNRIERDEDLTALRNEPAYREIVAMLSP